MANWWFDEQGRNNLSGVPDDPDNPPILPDELIVELLLTNAPAVDDLEAALNSLIPAERERIEALLAANPRARVRMDDEQVREQSFWAQMNAGPFIDPNRRRR